MRIPPEDRWITKINCSEVAILTEKMGVGYGPTYIANTMFNMNWTPGKGSQGDCYCQMWSEDGQSGLGCGEANGSR